MTKDEDLPKKAVLHEIGQDISLLSVGEITARIELLKAEISRLETESASKAKGREAAESLFRNPRS